MLVYLYLDSSVYSTFSCYHHWYYCNFPCATHFSCSILCHFHSCVALRETYFSSSHSVDSFPLIWGMSVQRRTQVRIGVWWQWWSSWGCVIVSCGCRSHCWHSRALSWCCCIVWQGQTQGQTICCQTQQSTLVQQNSGQQSHCETHFLN